MYQLLPLAAPDASPLPPKDQCAVAQDPGTRKVFLVFSDGSTIDLGAPAGGPGNGNPKSSTFTTTDATPTNVTILNLAELPTAPRTYLMTLVIGWACGLEDRAPPNNDGAVLKMIVACTASGFEILKQHWEMPLEDTLTYEVIPQVSAGVLQIRATGDATDTFVWGWTLSWSEISSVFIAAAPR